MNIQDYSVMKESDLMKRGLYAPNSFVSELLSKIDIVTIIREYVPLKKKGKDYFGLCPFHNEKTASFSVSPEKQFYHCFGCWTHGSVIEFLIEHLAWNYVKTVCFLAKKAGIKVRFVNFYREDYFWWLEEFTTELDLTKSEQHLADWWGKSMKRIEYLIQQKEWYEQAVATILSARDEKFISLLGKSYTEVTGLREDDVWNNELLPVWETMHYKTMGYYNDERAWYEYSVTFTEQELSRENERAETAYRSILDKG